MAASFPWMGGRSMALGIVPGHPAVSRLLNEGPAAYTPKPKRAKKRKPTADEMAERIDELCRRYKM